MPTTDFYSDAVQCLLSDPDGYYCLLYGQPGDTKARWTIYAPSEEHCKFFEGRFKTAMQQYRDLTGDNHDE